MTSRLQSVETSMVCHIEQIVNGLDVMCSTPGCRRRADLRVTSEPDNEPGLVCRYHGFAWIDVATGMLKAMYPRG